MILSKKITKDLKGKTVKDILLNQLNLSNRLIIKLKKYNQIYCNDKTCYTNHLVDINDIVCVNINFNEETNDNIIPVKHDLNILYEDDCLLIVNKDANVATHPSMLHFDNTLSNFVKSYYISNNINSLIRPVNRLDKNTSGIVIFAKNQYVQECLIRQMKTEQFKKLYLCIVEGKLTPKTGTICLPIARLENSIIKRCVSESGQLAITQYCVDKIIEINNEFYSVIHVNLKTGRTHQIRVHFSHINHPLIGDSLYGNESTLINRQALHCQKIELLHPITNNKLCITCELPNDIKNILNKL